MQFKFELGAKVRCKITGYKGVVTARSEHINGCVRYGVQSQKLNDGKPAESEWLDEQQLELIPGKFTMKKKGGGPMTAPKFFRDAPA